MIKPVFGVSYLVRLKPAYRKVSKFSDTKIFAVIILKLEKNGFYYRVVHPKDADSIANSEDPDRSSLI